VRSTGYVSHSIPGRIRIRVPDAKHNPALLEKLRESIVSAPGVKAVDCNPLTGSLLIRYSPAAHESVPAFLSPRDGSAPPLSLDPPPSNPPRRKVPKGASRHQPHSEAAQAVIDFFRDLNETVMAATDNQLDLRIVLPIAAGVLAITLLPKATSTPLWLTLTIFAFSSFMVLHAPGSAVAEMAEIATEIQV
jgi:Heavy metal associated domain 2